MDPSGADAGVLSPCGAIALKRAGASWVRTTSRPILRPCVRPVSAARRKWKPTKTRDSAFSRAACESCPK
jgi:hypothetical protein